jgi:tyrosine-protein phosphatase SIW14
MLIALLASSAIAQSDTRIKDKDLPNFHQVNKNLYRGAQPTLEGVQKLAELGIKTIVDLRGEDKLSISEAAVAHDAGINFRIVTMPDLGRPKDEQVETVLGIINDPQNWPVFVHCKHGEDRTGVIIACYRISQEGASAQDALKEAKLYGMSRFQFGMKDFIRDYFNSLPRTIPRSSSEMPSNNSMFPAQGFPTGFHTIS